MNISKEKPYKICFVCLGNICRSPTGEGVLQHLVHEKGLTPYILVDSAGTSAYHIGEPANHNSRQVADKYGITLSSKARRFRSEDLEEFDLILAMDEENYQNLLQMARGDEQVKKIRKLREFDPQPGDGNVPDPYYGGMDGFEKVYQIIHRSSKKLLEDLEKQIGSDQPNGTS